MNELIHRINEERGITFSPQINKKSSDMNRNVQNLLLWDNVKKIKQNEKKKIIGIYE